MSALLCCVATIGLHLASVHSNTNPKHPPNNVNPGVYVETTEGWTAGTYRNSQYRQSFYAGRTLDLDLAPVITASLTLGAITGYRQSPVLPLAVPSLRLRLSDDVATRVAYVPRVEKKGAAAVHLMVEFKL